MRVILIMRTVRTLAHGLLISPYCARARISTTYWTMRNYAYYAYC